MKKLAMLALLWMTGSAQALYYLNDVHVKLVNLSDEPHVVSLDWSHGSNWFSVNDSHPLQWDQVIVPANESVQSMFSVLVFPENKHEWTVQVMSLAGISLASFSGHSDDLVHPASISHDVTVRILSGGCQFSIERNGEVEATQAPDSATCVNGQHIDSIISSVTEST